jgi:hypothetical protein
MKQLSKSKPREIIDDFALEIAKAKRKGLPPTKTVIDFRNERRDGIERDIWYVPIELLRYRKNNGRISSDVLNYEKAHGLLDERSEESQNKIEEFLKEKDKTKTEELYNSMQHEGQREEAIITCDGFLINGNRRKMVMKMLSQEFPGDSRFKNMKVVILPGKSDEGGPPTILEIEQIENRYQLQSEAKAEYYAFDRALSMRRKIELGMSLDEQLRDDPIYAGLEKKEFKNALKKFEDEYLKPLDCIERYLAHLGREGLYSTVSTGLGDPEGRWQAFLDYYKFVYQKFTDEKKRIQLGICEDEIGKIEEVAFKIIRKREFPNLPKVHKIMRDFSKWLKNKDAKKELLKILDIDIALPKEERIDHNGNEYDERYIDKIWGKKYASKIINHVKKANDFFEHKKGQETPLKLLETALEKLKHENMNTKNVNPFDIQKAMKLIKEIQERAGTLEDEFYHYQKDIKKLKEKYSH